MTHRQKRARDYFEVRVNKNESFLSVFVDPKKEAQNTTNRDERTNTGYSLQRDKKHLMHY